MKIKLWQFEYDFDKDDAKIIIPVLLLALGLAFTSLIKSALWTGAVVYYALYFFLKPSVSAAKELWLKISLQMSALQQPRRV